MGRPRKNLANLKQVDGKITDSLPNIEEGAEIVPNVELRGKYRSLDELYGFQGSTYQTHDENTYASEIKQMSKADLFKECSRVGLLPNDNRMIMEERLLKKFQQETASILTAQVKPVVLKPSRKINEIMSAGANKV